MLIALVAYTCTLAPTVTLEDSGELVVAADYLGVPHPPGYPIWTLLAWLFQWVFHFVTFQGQPNPAWSVGFMSAFFGAAACAVLSLLVSRSGFDMLRGIPRLTKVLGTSTESLLCWVGGVAGGLLFAFSSVLWSQSVIVEVYSLNAFFLTLILLLTYRWMCRPHEDHTLYVVAFLFALGLTNHQSLLFAIFGLVLAIAFRDHRLFRDCMAGGLWLIAAYLFFKAGALGFSGNAAETHKVAALSEEALKTRGNMQIGAFVLMFVGWLFLLLDDDVRGKLVRDIDVWIIRGIGAIGIWALACFMMFKVGQFGTLKGPSHAGADTRMLVFFLLGLAFQAGAIWMIKNQLMTQWKRFVFLILLVVLGLSFYLYLPIASDQNPPMNWGYPRTEEGFWHALSRGQYEKFSTVDNFKSIFADPGHFANLLKVIVFNPTGFNSVVAQFTGVLAPFVLVALIAMVFVRFREQTWFLVSAVMFFAMTVLFVIVQWPDLDVQTLFIGRVQYIQAHAIYALWLSYGLIFVLAFLDSKAPGNAMVKYGGIGLAFLLPLILIGRNAYDENFLRMGGGVEQNGHDFGWQFGNYQLRGIEGILEELDPDETPPPSTTYPPPMGQDAIFFGGTDPGRFVPTYMIYSAKVRPDVFLITQNALADNTYMAVMRDLYGDSIWIPATQDSNRAFRQYVEDVNAGRIPPGAEVTQKDGRVSVQGVAGVMMINGILTKYIFDENIHKNPFYVEESYVIPWMYPYLTPNGLIMKINKDRLPKLPDELVTNDHEFWEWYVERLTSNPKFLRDVVARKTFSKLRSALGGLYVYRRNYAEAEFAFSQAIKLYDLSPEANFRLADAYTQQRKFDDAIEVITAFLEKDPENEKVRRYREQLITTSTKDKRRQELEPKLAQGADINTAIELLGIYRDLGQVAQFENLGGRLSKDDRLPAQVYQRVGQLSTQFRRFNLAIQAYTQATKKNPSDYKTWIELAAANLGARKAQESVNALARAVQNGGEPAREILRKDPRFNAIRSSQAFQTLVPAKAAARPTSGLNFPFGGGTPRP